MLWKIISALVVGCLCGCVANRIMGGEPKGFWKSAILGIIGGGVGGYLGNLIGVGDGWVTGLLLSVVGSCLVLWIGRKLFN